jgi:hypothetical protein
VLLAQVLICYDINFAELWMAAETLGADLVVWPSAMATPDPSTRGYATVFQYDIVAVGYPGELLGRDGLPIPTTSDPGFPMTHFGVVDVDRTFVHWDYNHDKVARLLAEHPHVVVDVAGPPFYLLRSTAHNASVRQLCREYDIETNREYVHRSRRGLNLMRMTGQYPS